MALWTRTDRDLLSLALPTFATLVSEPLLVMADTAFIGHVGAVPLAGLGLGGNVLGVITGMCVFLAYSTTSVVAHRLGAGRARAAHEAGRDGMALGAALGIVLAALLAWLAPAIIGWYGPAPDVAAAAVSYLRVVAAGLPFQLVVLASTGLLRGLQDTRTPMVVAIGVNLANIGLDALLIHGFGLGIVGSAVATASAQALSCIALVAVTARRCRGLGMGLCPSPAGMGAAASAGGWLMLRTATLWFSLTATTFVATGLGSLTLAAHQVTNSLYSFLTFALDSLAIACQALIGHRLGAGDPDGARTVMRRAFGWGGVQALVMGLALVAVRPWLARLFTSDPDVRRLVMHSFVVLAAIMPPAALVFVLDGVLIGAGDTRYLALAGLFVAACHLPMLAAVARLCAGGPAGLVWLWVAYAGFLAARGLTLTLRARTGRWLRTGAG
ncbi:MATE family efflux transporter [uncultured Bifidobacterium sp.]|uniref:MATE family efflux transporter n=1 Tax=uncultured Bifidobacterium sp. TaxID=165187 RepID=UPI0028DB3E31|nr:MATE family efflux transporter [uncultured Bifidobacterium sp.]